MNLIHKWAREKFCGKRKDEITNYDLKQTRQSINSPPSISHDICKNHKNQKDEIKSFEGW